MFKNFTQDVNAVMERDPAVKSRVEVVLLYAGFHAIVNHRAAHWLYKKKMFFLARLISQWTRFSTGIEIHPGAVIGAGVFIDHGSGVVIGETAIIGDGCTIYQGATLGGTGKDKGKRHPTLGKNVMVGAGAKILGPFTVGDNCKIASNAVLLAPLAENSTAVGVPAKAISIAGVRIDNSTLNQVDIPDPMQNCCNDLEERIDMLEKMVQKLEKQLYKPLEPDENSKDV